MCRQLPAPTSLGGGAIRSLLGTAVEGPTSSRYKCPVNKFTCDDEKKPLSDKAARWHAFVKRERPLVKQGLGLTGNAEVLKEVAARYKRHLAVGTPSQPPLLAGPSTDTESEASSEDGLVLALRELSQEEVVLALEAQGVEATPDAERNVALLAQALMA